MEEVQLNLDEKGKGAFSLVKEGAPIGEMSVSIAAGAMTVYHTEVAEAEEGKGFARRLLEAMVDHARQQRLQVIPLCSYVQVQFRRQPEMYEDVWKKV